jgi:hypothetical protein
VKKPGRFIPFISSLEPIDNRFGKVCHERAKCATGSLLVKEIMAESAMWVEDLLAGSHDTLFCVVDILRRDALMLRLFYNGIPATLFAPLASI